MDDAQLAYVVVGSRQPAQWTDFAERYLGVRPERDGDDLRLRIDGAPLRISIRAADTDRLERIGWSSTPEVAGRVRARIEAAAMPVEPIEQTRLEERGFTGGFEFRDPDGNCIEWVFGPESERAMPERLRTAGFRTGRLGMGHIVLTTRDVAAMKAFYTDLSVFRLSDEVAAPFEAAFLRANPRHHSLALIQGEANGVHHLMLEFTRFDDVGQTYDLALIDSGRIATTLGRHTNDYMTSFYLRTPAGFLLELGWGGRLVDDANWVPQVMDCGPSFWGHERTWLPEAARVRALEMRLKAANDGLGAPLQVTPADIRLVDE